MGREKVEKVKKILRFEGFLFVDGLNSGGGLALMWKEQGAVRLISYSSNFIDVSVHV